MENKKSYTPLAVEVVSVETERGYLTSPGSTAEPANNSNIEATTRGISI